MADMVPRVCRVLDQIEARDADQLGKLLAPDVHWTTAIEEQLHGREAVVGYWMENPPPAPPSWHETRGGLITRWIDCPG